MNAKRLAGAAMLSLVTLVVAVGPAAAQTSSTAGLINDLNEKLLYLAVPIAILVEAILIYTVWRFRNNDEAKPTEENRRLEITWTVATALVLLFVGVASYGVLANEDVTFQQGDQIAPEDDDVVVYAEAYQWNWNMSYPEHNLQTGTEIVVPVDQEVYFVVTSRDVIHAFHVPGLGLKQDAMPGKENVIKTVPQETGTYQGYCAEYCGVGHSNMYFTIEVVSQQEYQDWLEQQQSGQ